MKPETNLMCVASDKQNIGMYTCVFFKIKIMIKWYNTIVIQICKIKNTNK